MPSPTRRMDPEPSLTLRSERRRRADTASDTLPERGPQGILAPLVKDQEGADGGGVEAMKHTVASDEDVIEELWDGATTRKVARQFAEIAAGALLEKGALCVSLAQRQLLRTSFEVLHGSSPRLLWPRCSRKAAPCVSLAQAQLPRRSFEGLQEARARHDWCGRFGG